MNLALTSDFPSSVNEAVVGRIRAAGSNPRVAWMCPSTTSAQVRFHEAREAFRSFGVSRLEYCDIDQKPDRARLQHLERYDVVYLSGGDPILFRQNLRRHQIEESLTGCLASGRLLVAASGGAMQFARNLSLFRLLSNRVEDVVGEHAQYNGLGVVDFELLPHLNRLDATFLDKVCRYSELAPHDVVALGDGAAIVYSEKDHGRFFGQAMRVRRGVKSPIPGDGALSPSRPRLSDRP